MNSKNIPILIAKVSSRFVYLYLLFAGLNAMLNFDTYMLNPTSISKDTLISRIIFILILSFIQTRNDYKKFIGGVKNEI